MDQETWVSHVALSMDWVVNKIVMMWNVAQMYVFFFFYHIEEKVGQSKLIPADLIQNT